MPITYLGLGARQLNSFVAMERSFCMLLQSTNVVSGVGSNGRMELQMIRSLGARESVCMLGSQALGFVFGVEVSDEFFYEMKFTRFEGLSEVQ